MSIVGPHYFPKIWGKKAKATINVTPYEPPKKTPDEKNVSWQMSQVTYREVYHVTRHVTC